MSTPTLPSPPASTAQPVEASTARPVDSVDIVIVGGGPTGLAAAIALARSLRSVLVIDSGAPRNAASAHAHNVLGQEGIEPTALLAAGRQEAAGYGVRFAAAEATHAASEAEGVTLNLADGQRIHARALLLATGVRDRLPDIPGLADAWGGSVLHCPYCHGYEVRGQRIGVLATSPMSAHQALLFRQLSADVTVFLHAGPEALGAEAQLLTARGVRLVDAQVSAVLTESGRADGHPVQEGRAQTGRAQEGRDQEGRDQEGRVQNGRAQVTGVQLADGSVHALDALVVAPVSEPRAELFEQLGGRLAEHPAGRFIPVGPMFDTGIRHVWAAGNITDLRAMVVSSAGAGLSAAAAINASLATADAHAALAAQPAG